MRRHAVAPTESRLGVAAGAQFRRRSHATGDMLVFSDAHVMTPPGWAEPLLEVLARPEVGAVAPAIGMMRPEAPEAQGTGRNGPTPVWRWNGWANRAARRIRCRCCAGASWPCGARSFDRWAGSTPGMVLWGAEDSELSIRLWTSGYECWVVPRSNVEHAFRAQFPYEVKWEPVLHNRFRLATLHFGPRRLLRVVDRLKQYDEFAAASVRLLSGDLAARVQRICASRAATTTTGSSASSNAPVRAHRVAHAELSACSVPARSRVSACLVSWKRPQNLPAIVRSPAPRRVASTRF